jgi:hypothetical protein
MSDAEAFLRGFSADYAARRPIPTAARSGHFLRFRSRVNGAAMPKESRQAHADTLQLLLPWGTPLPEGEDGSGAAALWLAGGASLLLWTGVALLLTAV